MIMENRYNELDSYYQSKYEEQNTLTQISFQSQQKFWEHTLLVSLTLFGIVISFHVGMSQSLYTRLAFYLSCTLLLVGILTAGIAFYNLLVRIPTKGRILHLDELKNAQKKHRMMSSTVVKDPIWLKICEIISLVSLILSLLALFSYAILKDLNL